MQAGIIALALGMICAGIAISPLFIANLILPSYWWGLSMLTVIGLGLILLGLRSSAKTRSKAMRDKP